MTTKLEIPVRRGSWGALRLERIIKTGDAESLRMTDAQGTIVFGVIRMLREVPDTDPDVQRFVVEIG